LGEQVAQHDEQEKANGQAGNQLFLPLEMEGMAGN
jgi:hypothetical protein